MILSYPARKGEGEALIYVGGGGGGGGGGGRLVVKYNFIQGLFGIVSLLFIMKAEHSSTTPVK